MTHYKHKPVVIEAERFTGGFSFDEMGVEWGEEFMEQVIYNHAANELWIDTLEGRMRADIGDYVIRGVGGEFYPCKPEIFIKLYELAEPNLNG